MNLNTALKRMRLKIFCLTFSGLVYSFLIFSQPLNVSGRVTSADNELLTGVTVMVKGKSTGTSTNAEGRYFIYVNREDSLVFSYIGYIDNHVAVASKTTVNVTLESIARNLTHIAAKGPSTVKF